MLIKINQRDPAKEEIISGMAAPRVGKVQANEAIRPRINVNNPRRLVEGC
jgi:hypothetical protein